MLHRWWNAQRPAGLCHAYNTSGHPATLMHAGAYSSRAEGDTAFPWRTASFVMDATVSFPTALVGLLPNATLELALAAPNQFLR